MKREIKFRVWDQSENQMSYSDTEFFDDMIAFRFKHWGIDIDTIDDIELMQFTGLKDKQGKEIYEGDIVKCDDIIVPVTWDDGAFQIKTNPQQGASYFIQDRAKRFEVIGNIYQNSELLKQ